MSYRVAVVGASGNVGRKMLQILAERAFPVSEVAALASQRSCGNKVSFGDTVLQIQDLATFDFAGWDIVLSSAGAAISAQFAGQAAAAGAVVIDNTSHFRMDPDVPLVVPEVNPQAIDMAFTGAGKGIIANPNCSTIQMVVALKPLHDTVPIRRIVVSTYQSVSGGGKAAMDELFTQTRAVYVSDPLTREVFTKDISFNCIPHIDHFMPDRSTKEEWKMVVETGKILDPAIKVSATCVRVPVFIGHGESVNVEFAQALPAERARRILRKAPGVDVVDDAVDGGYISPRECSGEDAVFVSRLRDDPTVDFGVNMWIVSDNLRKGAALNAIQIAETMIGRAAYMRKGGKLASGRAGAPGADMPSAAIV